MRGPFRSLVFCILMPLAGCAVGNVASHPTPVDTSLTGNWQIQTAAAAPTVPLTGVLLLGALQQQGSAVTGTFRVFYLNGSALCGNTYTTPTAFSGTFDSSRNLTLTSSDFTIKVQLAVPVTLTTFGTGTIQTFGTTCALANSSPAIAAQTASLTGTFSGPVAANPTGAPTIPTGTASLTLTQTGTPQSDGQFPLTGTLNFTGGSCTSSVAVSGTVSGGEVMLSASATSPLTLSQELVIAFAPPTATQLTSADLIYGQGPCSSGLLSTSSYTGTLSRQ